MSFEFVRQPNGLLARFSSAVDQFTHLNLSPDEARELESDLTDEQRLEVERAAADADLARWQSCLEWIEATYDRQAVEEIEALAADGQEKVIPGLWGAIDMLVTKVLEPAAATRLASEAQRLWDAMSEAIRTHQSESMIDRFIDCLSDVDRLSHTQYASAAEVAEACGRARELIVESRRGSSTGS